MPRRVGSNPKQRTVSPLDVPRHKPRKETKIEIWKDIPGHELCYQVSNRGRVRSLGRRVRLVAQGIETTRFSPGKLLRPGPSRSGHFSVSIGKGNSCQVHQLVMLAFTGPCPLGHEVLHKNHTPSDNRHVNLKYGTRGENITMDYAVGTRTVSPNLVLGRGKAFGKRSPESCARMRTAQRARRAAKAT